MYEISSSIYLNKQTECYERILTIYPSPHNSSELKIKCIRNNDLSKFNRANRENCACKSNNLLYLIINPDTNHPYCINELPLFINMLQSTTYSIEYNLSKLFGKQQNIQDNITQSKFLFYIV